MKTHPAGMLSLALAAVFLLIFALAVTHAADLAATDCSPPVANGGIGYCGPSQVRVCSFGAALRYTGIQYALVPIRSRYFLDM